MIVTWAVAGLGMFCLPAGPAAGQPAEHARGGLVRLRRGHVAQVAHLGLVAGLSWVPVQLLSVLRLTETREHRLPPPLDRGPGRDVRPHDPGGRAACDRRRRVIVVIYRGLADHPPRTPCGPSRHPRGRGLCRWWPGARHHASVRCSGCRAWPSSARPSAGRARWPCSTPGSLPHRWLLLMLVPDLLGGASSLGQPAFFANYNLAEVIGLRRDPPARRGGRPARPPPAAATAPRVGRLARDGARRVRARARRQHSAGSLLAHLPLVQRPAAAEPRTSCVADLALAVLLAYWADQPLQRQELRGSSGAWRPWGGPGDGPRRAARAPP